MSLLGRIFKKSLPAHQTAGLWGEAEAEKHLQEKGFRILGRRVRVGRKDELDLVAKQGEVLVFVEVKTRKNEDFGRPIESVNRAKRQHLSRAAIHYLTQLKPCQRPSYFRFDVVEIVGEPGAPPRFIRHIETAFTMESGYRVPW